MKKKVLHVSILVYLFTTNLFGKSITSGVESKIEDVNDSLTGDIAVALMTLAIIIAGIGLLFNYFSKSTAVKIFGGGILIGAAGSIAEFIMG